MTVEWVVALIVAGVGALALVAWLLGVGSSRAAARAGAVEAGERAGDWLTELADWVRRGR